MNLSPKTVEAVAYSIAHQIGQDKNSNWDLAKAAIKAVLESEEVQALIRESQISAGVIEGLRIGLEEAGLMDKMQELLLMVHLGLFSATLPFTTEQK